MEKLNPQAQAFLASMADAPTLEPPPFDPTKPASEEERAYWQKQQDMFCGGISMLVKEGTNAVFPLAVYSCGFYCIF